MYEKTTCFEHSSHTNGSILLLLYLHRQNEMRKYQPKQYARIMFPHEIELNEKEKNNQFNCKIEEKQSETFHLESKISFNHVFTNK